MAAIESAFATSPRSSADLTKSEKGDRELPRCRPYLSVGNPGLLWFPSGRHKARLLGLGAIGVIAKPFDPMALPAEIDRVLGI